MVEVKTLIWGLGDAEDVEAMGLLGEVGMCYEVSQCSLRDALLFSWIDGGYRFPRIVGLAHTDLYKDDGIAILGDDVDLAPTGPLVGGEDREALFFEVVGRDLFGISAALTCWAFGTGCGWGEPLEKAAAL